MVKQYTLETFSNLVKGKKLYLYGAGKRGRMWHRCLTHRGFKISGFIDIKEKGENIFRPDFLKDLPSLEDVFICISTIDMHVREISEKLQEYGFKRDINYINASQACNAYPTIEVSGLCNLHCMSCNLDSHLEGRKGGVMSLDMFSKILDKLTTEAPIMPFLSLFLWGDPLINPELPQIIRKCTKNGISVDVSTNLNFGKSVIERVIAASPSCLAVPCSGIGANYELTHTGGKWELFEKNLYRVREYIDKYNADTSVQVSYHLYKHNLGKDYDYVRDLVQKLGFSFKPVIAVLFPERIFEAVAYGKPIPENMKRISKKMLYSIDEQKNYSRSKKGKFENICTKVFPTIRWDGSVVACYNMEGGKIADNYLEVSLDELKRRRDTGKLCRDCKKFNMQQ
ncbi:MAG: hypothetical protein PHE49_07595, partial [bacterium]|nr:hypothetical protein [bacterium]